MEEFWIHPIDHTRGHVPQTVGFTGVFQAKKIPPGSRHPMNFTKDAEKRRRKKSSPEVSWSTLDSWHEHISPEKIWHELTCVLRKNVNLWISQESIYNFGGPYHTIDGSISRSTTAKDHLTVDGIMAPPGQWQNPANSPAQRWRFVEIPVIYRAFKSTIPGGWEWEFGKPSTIQKPGRNRNANCKPSWNGACKVNWVNPLFIQLALLKGCC